MVDTANGAPDAKPPPELRLLWMCEKWGQLPEEGAPLEQDYTLHHRMTVFGNIYAVINKWNHLEGKAVHTLTNSERNTLSWLQKMGLMF